MPLLLLALFQYPPQTRPRNTRHLCGLRLVIAVHLEDLLRIILIEFLDGPDLVRLDRFYREHLDGLGQAGRHYRIALLEDDRALDDVLQFAHISRITVMHQHLERLFREPRDLLAGTENVFFQKIRAERQDVVPSIAERGDGDLHDVQPVIQVLLEPALGDNGPHVLVGGRDETNVDLNEL